MDKDWKSNSTSLTTHGFHNFSEHDREKRDFYATNPIALEKLFQYETFKNVWECACGNGHLSKVLIRHGIHARSSDIIVRDFLCEKLDFLAYKDKWYGDIITNPPYKYATLFVYKALEVINEGNRVAMIFPQRYLSSKERYKLFTEHNPQFVYAFSGRISCALNGDFTAHSNSAVDYMWIIWKKGYKGDTILRWIV